MRTHFTTLLLVGLCHLFFSVFSQSTQSSITNYFNVHKAEIGLSDAELKNWVIYNEHTSDKLGITYAYIRQQHEGIEVYNAVANFAVKDDQVLMTGNNLLKNIADKVNTNQPSISPEEAILAAATQLGLEMSNSDIRLKEKDKLLSVYSADGISSERIPVKLMYFPTADNDIRLVWDLSINTLSKDNWWSIRIDALTGIILDKLDWVVRCNFEVCEHSHTSIHASNVSTSNSISECVASTTNESLIFPAPPPATDQYNVFAIPTESPNHGPRTMVVGPSDAIASPFGWHDDNGLAGVEYTITRGNNVYATEDVNSNNGFGYAPDGGASINFDFPLNLNQQPINYQDPVITNLFYMNNIMHDIWHQYGFDEASGNFQENNYGNGGVASDGVYADAQDGGGTNNANFATPADGSNPRMQMFLWSPGISNLLTINSPAGIAGDYAATEAGFGAPVPVVPITSNLVLFDDNTAPDINDACQAAINAAAMNGNIVVIMRGDCEFGFKVLAAENNGATAVIVINNVAGAPIVMGAGAVGGSVTIPSVMISNVDGATLLAEMALGTVNGTLQAPAGSFDLDGDLDNGIIAHEYGHGISTRLTGGAGNSNCLSNAEQMGEGWSDWFGLMLTIEPGDLETDIRGIGTYASGEPVTGYGIRPAPYTTNLAINNYTYAATNNTGAISQPHGIGFVWATMLWDLTWAMIDKYGFDPDLYNGSGGNNMTMSLVINGLKLQPCSPGFEDGRDAILQADQLLYGGANQCLIWNAFASRGLGFSADQGSTSSRTDQVEAFDLPPSMINTAGSANVSACANYTWAANNQTYTSSGSYTTILANASGCDSTATLNLTINPSTAGSATIAACNTYTWPTDGNTYTASGAYPATLVNAQGCDSIVTLNLTINTEVTASQNVTACSPYIWPADSNTYSTSGTYTATLTSALGCDSIITLGFTMSTSAATNQSVTACDSYTWPTTGSTYISTGVYDTTMLSATGCDSIVTLDLTINTSYVGSTGNISACDSYFWPADGNTYTSSGIFNTTLTNTSGCDSIVSINLTVGNSTSGSETVTSCDSYTWLANGQTYTSGGTYVTTLTNIEGCDSTTTLNLTINTVNVAINYVDEITLSAGATGATYQWLDCNDNFSIITGETNQTYAPTLNGSYACQINVNGCIDTTACRTVSKLGILENDFGTALTVFPNPTFGKVTIELGQSYEIIQVELLNLSGQIIMHKEIISSDKFDVVIDGAPGFYFIELNATNDKKAVIKILKE